MTKPRKIDIRVYDDAGNWLDRKIIKVADDQPAVTITIEQPTTTFDLSLKRRFCNRCNRLMKSIEREPYCNKCGCPEFRLALPEYPTP